jgi:hypothetical protein
VIFIKPFTSVDLVGLSMGTSNCAFLFGDWQALKINFYLTLKIIFILFGVLLKRLVEKVFKNISATKIFLARYLTLSLCNS